MQEPKALILRGVAGVYLLANPENNFQGKAVARGLFRKDNIKPLPGDVVYYKPSHDPDIPYYISEILPRKNQLARPPMANLDRLFLLAAATNPAIDFHYLDRMICYARNNHMDLSLVLTKCDEVGAEEGIKVFEDYFKFSGFPRYHLSLEDHKVVDELKEIICSGGLSAFAGQSGVGKSTLMNRIMGSELLETGNLSEKVGRGKQTTRSVEIYQVGKAFLADTPGFQSLDIEKMGIEARDLVLAYPEIMEIAQDCRFSDCKHMGDVGCAIAEAKIHPKRLENYRKLRKDLEDHVKY